RTVFPPFTRISYGLFVRLRILAISFPLDKAAWCGRKIHTMPPLKRYLDLGRNRSNAVKIADGSGTLDIDRTNTRDAGNDKIKRTILIDRKEAIWHRKRKFQNVRRIPITNRTATTGNADRSGTGQRGKFPNHRRSASAARIF